MEQPPRVRADGTALPPMLSYAQNFEDVLLRRVLQDIQTGFYIDIGAFDPAADSVTKWFYDQGWSGINVEPNPEMHRRLAAGRPRDINLDHAVGGVCGTAQFWIVEGTGLSSLGRPAPRPDLPNLVTREITVPVITLAALIDRHAPGQTIDFLKIDAEGAEGAIIAHGELDRHRPRIILIEATEPSSQRPAWADWEPSLLDQGYQFALFDGLNRFYVRDEDQVRLHYFALPPGCFDSFLVVDHAAKARELDTARRLHEMFEATKFLQTALEETQKAVRAEQSRADDNGRRLKEMWDAAQYLEKLVAETEALMRAERARAENLEKMLADTEAKLLAERVRTQIPAVQPPSVSQQV